MEQGVVKRTKFLTRRKFLAAAFGVPTVAVADSFWVEPGWLKTTRVRLGEGAATHKVVHFTDLHHKGDRAYLQRVVTGINALKPDFVCFTGDLVEEAEHLPETLELLRTIQVPVYGVPGNHDYWASIDFGKVTEAFAATGGAWLMDQSARTRDGRVNLIGATCNHQQDFSPAPGLKNILLIHYPAWVKKLAVQRYDLILAGHSHGGQVRLPFIGPLVVPSGVDQYDLGLFKTPLGPLYVNAGIGFFYANIRFNCRPELTVFEL
jgi:predicted MPP superfamily phosphohydrolase